MRASDADRDRVLDVLRTAAGEGRLTADEFEERVQAVLAARTFGELAALTADLPVPGRYVPSAPLPPVPVPPVVTPAEPPAQGDILIARRGGSITHTGHWTVPRRIVLRPSWCDVTLDFTDAVLAHDTLLVEMRMRGGTLTLVAGPGVIVDATGLTVRYTEVEMRPNAEPGAKVVLRVLLVGRMRYGRIEVRRPGRPAGW